jgi:DNA-binding GntR family transcriptional regulator
VQSSLGGRKTKKNEMDQAESRLPIRRSAKKSARAIQRQKPLHAAAVERLRDMIIEGDLAVGERLHDANLAEILQVSRTPVREAIKLLAIEGLVELLPGRGARVAALSIASVSELFEVIAGIERHACELAAVRMTARDFDKLQRMHERMAGHHRAGERHDYFKLNQEIHLAIVGASKNAILQSTHATLIAKGRRGRYTALASQARWTEAMAEHELLMQAFADRDGRKAGEIMLQHDRRTGAVVLELLEHAAPTEFGTASGVQSGLDV